MSTISYDMNVADIVTAIPMSADLFRKSRIDYCCGGKITLTEAAIAAGLEPEKLLAAVQEIESERIAQNSMDPTSFGEKTLVAYIQERYHESLRKELPNLEPLVAKIVKVHGERHPELQRVQEIFNILSVELIDHTNDEDTNVFPLVLEFLANPIGELKEQIKPHIFELESEHDNAGKLLFELGI